MGAFDKILSGFRDDDDLDDDDDYEVDEEYESRRESSRSASKVTSLSKGSRKSGTEREVCIIKPTSFDDTREIADTLLANRTVVLNLEGLDVGIAQRIIDFSSGATYAMGGNFQKVSRYIFILTPKGVDVSGDSADGILGNGNFDVPSMKGNF